MAVYVSNRMANDPLILLPKEDDAKSCEWYEQRVAGVAKELKRPVLTSRLAGGFEFDCGVSDMLATSTTVITQSYLFLHNCSRHSEPFLYIVRFAFT